MKRLFLISITVLYICLLPAVAWIHGTPVSGGSPNTIALSSTFIVEMSANGTTLGSASIVGVYIGSPSWSLSDPLSVFQIDSTTGVVTVANNTNLVNATHPTIPITISATGTTPSNTPGNFTVTVTVAGGPGLALGTYGSTTASGWTTIIPSDGTLASAATTNVIYVSDSLGDDNRDGSTPTFVDDNTTEQFVLSSNASPVAGDTYTSPNGKAFTVAVSNTTVKLVQTTGRTGLPDASGTLTCSGSCSGPMTMAYTAATPGIHGPVKTLIKGAGGTGPGVIADLDHTGANNGDGTGLGTIGNWHVAGAGSGFALRSGKPDWLLLRKGDTFVGQTIEVAWDASGGSDNFGKSGFSEQEPMVISSYDENFPVTVYGANVGARARPIIQIPSSSAAYAAMQSAGTQHEFYGRPGLAASGNNDFVAVMGLVFYSAQRDPTNMATYVGAANIDAGTGGNAGIPLTSGHTGWLIEDIRVSWTAGGVGTSNTDFDLNIRRTQVDHCYATDTFPSAGRPLAFAIDDTKAASGPIWSGFNFEENVIDLCGYVTPQGVDPTFAPGTGNSRARNVYIQWDTILGNRRGNTSTRSGSENLQLRSGGVIDDNFTYGGSYGFEVGHALEGQPTLTSATSVTNNVVVTTDSPFGTGYGVGISFVNSNDITASNNLVAQYDPAAGANGYFSQTDAYLGGTSFMDESAVGSGGTLGYWPCVGGANFTGGHGTVASNYTIHVGAGGSLDDPSPIFVVEPVTNDTFLLGDVLTPVANYPSINTAGVSITAAGTGGTAGNYGFAFSFTGCSLNPANGGFGTGGGIPLTNFSGSMAGSGALATFNLNDFTSTTRALNGGTGFYDATGTVPTGTNTIMDANNLDLSTFTTTITTYGFTPSAYNGTWTITSSIGDNIVWSLGTNMDPGPVTVQGHLIATQIISTGKDYQVGDVLEASPSDIGGQTGLRITVGSISHLTGWQLTVLSLTTAGVHGLTWTGNTVFNWPPGGPTAVSGVDHGGTHDSPGGVPGSGVANTWTGNVNCDTAQFTGVITGTNTLTTSALVQGTIAIGQNLAGPSVTASTTITGGSGTSWTVSPNQTAPSETMYSYTCTPTTVFPHPENTIDTYAASLGLTASIDGYLYDTNGAMNNAKWNWDPALTANNGINPYIRHGFGMTP